jgi:hypothetical protein
MATEKLKVEYKAQNKTCTNPQIKTHKKSHEQTDRITDITQKSRTRTIRRN